MRQRVLAWATAATLATAILADGSRPAMAEGEGAALSAEEVEKIVRDYLMREPEVIYEAILAYQEREKLAEEQRQKQALTARADEIFNDERDGVMNPDGDVTLVEFYDYRCGYCRSMTAGLRALLEQDRGIRYVMKEYPILGEESTQAARAALAAKNQGAYTEFHTALMSASDMSMGAIERLAEHYELDFDRLAQDMESDEVNAHIADTLDLGRALGISGTPSFILGDTLIPGAVPINQLAELVKQQR